MDYQVSRLASRMGGDAPDSPLQEAARLEQRWFNCGPVDPKQDNELNQRFLVALQQFEKSIR